MIRLYYEGGLGNQMFQYAFGRSMQKRFNEAVEYDVSRYFTESDEIRDFHIEKFNVDTSWKRMDIKKSRIEQIGYSYYFYGAITKLFFILQKRVDEEKKAKLSGCYQKLINRFGFYRCHDNNYIEPVSSFFSNKNVRGHWFDYTLFENVKAEIFEELRVITPISEQNQRFLDEIKNGNSTAVHIRRGDYVTIPGYLVCDIDYYQRGMQVVSEKQPDTTFYVFSDDIPWCKENLQTEKYKIIFVDIDNDATDDMRLMYSCDNFIISNSTFSWWAQWLGRNKDKIVVAPDRWYSDGKKKDCIYCDYWTVIES